MRDASGAAAWLRTPEAIRARCHRLLDIGRAGGLAHFKLDLSLLPVAAAYVSDVIRQAYPDLAIPYHARWRHFGVGGIDRWQALAARLDAGDPQEIARTEIARTRIDLCVVSVLLDAGAGPGWRYLEPGIGLQLSRSEGLAVASLDAFRAGLFSGDGARPLRADAAGLAQIDRADIERAFQASATNPLAGAEGRARLMNALGEALLARPDMFTAEARIGRLYDYLVGQAKGSRLQAATILGAVLDAFQPIWPSRLKLEGHDLGDVWRHSLIVTDDATSGLVPFHKLSQWLTYSLIEVFEESGVTVDGVEALTGLPEYRNGGLFLDLGVIALRDPAVAARPLEVDSEIVVEWRALTLALLDLVAEPVRASLGRTASEMPLACILEGGTWAAGRKIASERRADGSPPLTIISDGTVF